MKKLLYGMLVSGGLGACTGTGSSEKVLEEAYAVHEEALAIYGEASALYKKLKTTVSGDAAQTGCLDSLGRLLHHWEEELEEVPGFEHRHAGHEAHEHRHHTPRKMPGASHLEYQQRAKEAVAGIRNGLENCVSGREVTVKKELQ